MGWTLLWDAGRAGKAFTQGRLCTALPPHPSLEGKRLRALSRKHGGERGETPEGGQGCERAGGKGQPAREGSVPSPPALRCQTERDTSQGRLGWWTRCQGQWTRCVNHLKEVSKNGDSGWGASLQKESHLGGRCPDRLPGGGSPRVGRPGSQHVSRATLPAAPPPPRTGDVLPQNRLKFSLRPDCPPITSASSHMRSHAPWSPWLLQRRKPWMLPEPQPGPLASLSGSALLRALPRADLCTSSGEEPGCCPPAPSVPA